MSVWFVGSGRVFDTFLIDSLQKQHSLEVLDQSSFTKRFLKYVLSCRTGPVNLTVVIDINCIAGIKSIISLVRQRGTASVAGLNVITLSSFSTWGGKIYKSAVNDCDAAFRERIPLASAFDAFAMENSLLSVLQQNGVQLRIVGCGLFYGADGLDLRSILMAIWGDLGAGASEPGAAAPVRQGVLQCKSDAVVPIMNIWSFTTLISTFVGGDAGDGSVFVPAVDCPVLENGSPVPFCDLATRLEAQLNGAATPSNLFACDAADRSPAWQCSIPFARSPVQSNLLSAAADIWAEFLASNSLRPLSVLLAGPPRLGKSEIAKLLAERLKVEVITAESAVKFLFRARSGEGFSEEVAAGILTANAELKAAVDAKASEGKKPAKGAPVAEEGVIDEAVFTALFCLALPAELLRKCVSAQARLSQACQRRGFVLDLWDGKTLLGAESLREALNAILPPQEAGAAPASVDLVAELHCPANLPVERLVSSQGAQAKAKESQAAVKALEAQVATYSAALTALPPSADGVQAAAHMSTGHQGVLEILRVASEASTPPTTCRVDCVSADGASAAGVAGLIAAAMVSARGGNIGWLQFPSSSGAPAESAPVAQDESAAAAQQSLVAPTAGPAPAVPVKASVADQIKQLDIAKMEVLGARAAKLEAFLMSSVLPQLTAGLVKIQREQPEDPIMFLAQQLLEHSAATNRHAEDQARLRFIDLLHNGGL